jgi:hypothetical protein
VKNLWVKRIDNLGGSVIIKERKIETAGLMFVSHRDDLYKYAVKVKPLQGFEDVVFHADRTSFLILDPETDDIVQRISPKELSEILRGSNNYNGSAIRLLSCQAGYGGEQSLAKQLANELGVEVMAPTETLAIDNTGKTFISDNTVLLDMWGDGIEVKPTGKWETFTAEVRK